MSQYMQSTLPNISTDVNSVTGDLIVTPEALQITALETAIDRVESDLNLGNVAQGVIYNCDFVAEYLKNFGTDSSGYLKASGVLRIAFTASKEYVLDRGIQFKLSKGIFRLYLPNEGPYVIRPVGAPPKVNENGTALRDSGSGVFYADVPVVGASSVVVNAGERALVNMTVQGMGAITALIDFDPGTESVGLPELAKRTQTAIYSASLNTRSGATRFIQQFCPFIEHSSIALRGDKEMARDVINPYGMGAGYMDVYASSKSYMFEDVQTLRLERSGAAFPRWDCNFDYTGQIYQIVSVKFDNDTPAKYTIEGDSTDPIKAYMYQAAYSQCEKLQMVVTGMDQDVPYHTDVDGKTYVLLTVRYKTDPMVHTARSIMTSPDVTPVNTDILVRGFIPVILSGYTVQYVRQPGVVPTLDWARVQIASYLRKCVAPEVYSDAVVVDIMKQAGVKYVDKLSCNGHVQWSLADMYGGSVVAPVVKITATSDLRVSYPTGSVDPVNMCAAGVRNIRYLIGDDQITFVEIKSIQVN
ncbi:MAG: hypothetical protein RR182_00475 [Alistipes sp.]